MLKGIDPRLDAHVLFALKAMGHGDTLVVCDTNFPADAIARQTGLGQLISVANVSAPDAVEAILSLLPVEAAARMEVMGAPDEIPPVQAEVQEVLTAHEPGAGRLSGVERFAFYEEAKKAFCVVATGERRFYGCFILTKGVIPPEA
ncbi:MAG: RbsD/FucU domain-containing protein [Pseudomonadota bacterium]